MRQRAAKRTIAKTAASEEVGGWMDDWIDGLDGWMSGVPPHSSRHRDNGELLGSSRALGASSATLDPSSTRHEARAWRLASRCWERSVALRWAVLQSVRCDATRCDAMRCTDGMAIVGPQERSELGIAMVSLAFTALNRIDVVFEMARTQLANGNALCVQLSRG